MKIKKCHKASRESGFTIIEVLIASTVFVISFTVMVTLLDTTINRFSNKDLAVGTYIAQEMMLSSLATQDTSSYETVLTHDKISYSVSKKAIVRERLTQVLIEVKREKTKKQIISLYNEFLLSQKQ